MKTLKPSLVTLFVVLTAWVIKGGDDSWDKVYFIFLSAIIWLLAEITTNQTKP